MKNMKKMCQTAEVQGNNEKHEKNNLKRLRHQQRF
jgi:hypothetical protein